MLGTMVIFRSEQSPDGSSKFTLCSNYHQILCSVLCMFSFQILQNYKTDPKISRFLQNLDFYVLPVLNIDGYIYSWKKVSSENPGTRLKVRCAQHVLLLLDRILAIKQERAIFTQILSWQRDFVSSGKSVITWNELNIVSKHHKTWEDKTTRSIVFRFLRMGLLLW